MTDERWQIRATGGLLGVWYIAAVAFLFAPLVASVVYSFNLIRRPGRTSRCAGRWSPVWKSRSGPP